MISFCFFCRHLTFKLKPDKIEIKTKDGVVHKKVCSDCAAIIEGFKTGKLKEDNDLKQFEERINKHDSI